ncbi:hypothetical protein FRX31_022627 [Thalictrum thalictroides]|uniref:Reverse transcriptase zinc-binding domain-containing protein n=1 Tax=Thalictrum thalictroides TaxID=46969 RepID=A0A7J6VRR1_THATH|nr:hypothetical protein FRX31_022627 [Thalictrum thalictroides]
MKPHGFNSPGWDFSLRRALYDWEQEQMTDLLGLLDTLVFEDVDDSWFWKDGKQGVFTVSLFYNQIARMERAPGEQSFRFPTHLVWHIKMPTNAKFFFWCAIRNSILTADTLIHKGTHIDPVCTQCGLLNESISHVFFHCPFALHLWSELLKPRLSCLSVILSSDTVEELLSSWPAARGLQLGKRVWALLPYAVMWTLWRVVRVVKWAAVQNWGVPHFRVSVVLRGCFTVYGVGVGVPVLYEHGVFF